MQIKEATSVCKAILRNGFDAYIINAGLQESIEALDSLCEIDIACEGDYESLVKVFPQLEEEHDDRLIGRFIGESGTTYRFYSIEVSESAHPDLGFLRISPRMLKRLQVSNSKTYKAIIDSDETVNLEDFFEERTTGYIRLRGVPYRALLRNYRLAITALRLSANYDLPIDPATWLAIVRSAHYIGDYLPTHAFSEEMRLVSAENLWKFIQLLADSTILHSLIPEVAALQALKQQKNKEDSTEVTVFEHTVLSMRYYPEESLHYDWIGAVALLFHCVGKLYTADYFHDRWTFYQYHRVGAQVTRRVLRRLHFPSDEIDTICNLIRNHIRFQSMLTYRGMQNFFALSDTSRLIEMARANIKASEASYTNFNHNLKYLEQAELPEYMVKPLLTGNDIMEITKSAPGKQVGVLREALLQAQIAGEVTNNEQARDFVLNYKFSEDEE